MGLRLACEKRNASRVGRERQKPDVGTAAVCKGWSQFTAEATACRSNSLRHRTFGRSYRCEPELRSRSRSTRFRSGVRPRCRKDRCGSPIWRCLCACNRSGSQSDRICSLRTQASADIFLMTPARRKGGRALHQDVTVTSGAYQIRANAGRVLALALKSGAEDATLPLVDDEANEVLDVPRSTIERDFRRGPRKAARR